MFALVDLVVDRLEQEKAARRRFNRFFQHVELDGAMTADLLGGGMGGKPWVLAMDRTNWDFGKTTINIPMISMIWNDAGVTLIWTLLPPELAEGGKELKSGMRLFSSVTQTSGVRDPP